MDTGQERCYDNRRQIEYPRAGEPFFGQDAQYQGNQPAYRDNGDGTVTDLVTGLMWQKDPGPKKTVEQAVAGASLCRVGGYDDWRLPNIKELQSLVDYTRSPDTTQSAAIDPVFSVTPIRDALGEINYPFYWSSTTHKRMGGGEAAAYVAFGRSQGWMPGFRGQYDLLDVHGAGSQRSDPKAGDPSRFPRGRGPQGDVICIYNMVRPVRGGEASVRESGPELAPPPPGRRVGGLRPGGQMGCRQIGPGRLGSRNPMGGNFPGFVDRLDRNADGKVSRQEFDGPAQAFDRLDADKDGYLIEAEAPHRKNLQGPPPGNRPGPPRRNRQGRPRPRYRQTEQPHGTHAGQGSGTG